MDTIFSWPVVAAFLVCVGALIFATIGTEERPPLRLIPKVELDKLVAATFSTGDDHTLAGGKFTTARAIGTWDCSNSHGLPGVNVDLERYSWREVRASCSAEYAAVFDHANEIIHL